LPESDKIQKVLTVEEKTSENPQDAPVSLRPISAAESPKKKEKKKLLRNKIGDIESIC
jgi:hypothetical protein